MSDERANSPRGRLEANARGYANALREAQPKAEASQRHLDQMLTWAIGLMGGALFYLPNLLQQACPSGVRPRLVWIAAPWVLGILLALVGRIWGRVTAMQTRLRFTRSGTRLRAHSLLV